MSRKTSTLAATSYLAAERQHHEAARLMVRREQLFDELVERGIDDNTAYARAGVHLADIRSIRAYQKMTRALKLLRAL
jgi:hypothetical protein